MIAEDIQTQPSLKAKTPFGTVVSPHMLLSRYKAGSWSHPEILPFGNFSVAPTCMAFHYGQTIFEGMKAFKRVDGRISIFRLDKHYRRLEQSSIRMCMPIVPYNLFAEGLKNLVKMDAASVPADDNSALYIRPTYFASEEHYSARVANEYTLVIFTGPVDEYFDRPLHLKVEDQYIRAAKGGMGYAKCGGNYGGSFYATALAKDEGFDGVIWTDGSSDLNMEESGTMNIFFRIDDVLITPPLSDTILDGITRDSIITLAKQWKVKVQQRKISAWELLDAHNKGMLQEAFGCGTAAVTVPFASVNVKGQTITMPAPGTDSFSSRTREFLKDLRKGAVPDEYGWITIV